MELNEAASKPSDIQKRLEKMDRAGWVEVRRGFGSLDLSTLRRGQFVTASGLHDGGYIVWTLKGTWEDQ